MNKKQMRKKTRELIRDVSKHMRKNLERIISERMVDSKEWEDNWVLPKVTIVALLREEQRLYTPPDGNHWRKSRNTTEQIYTKL